MMETTYRGRLIQLRPRQEPDGTWVAEYSISTLAGYAVGSFSSSDEAEAAALEAAHSVIDSSGPSDGPIN
ncbi:MAG: hypothetical protein NDI90_17080 [Nitrospira sp. BO4]|jgi:hypothetical protein|nr:hypothetical protein [Nitrospira sp. BO4]